jgi:hypothetical protein
MEDLYSEYERRLIIAFSCIAGMFPNGDLVHALPKPVCLEWAGQICKELYGSLNSMPALDQQRILQSRIETLSDLSNKVPHSYAHGKSHDAMYICLIDKLCLTGKHCFTRGIWRHRRYSYQRKREK